MKCNHKTCSAYDESKKNNCSEFCNIKLACPHHESFISKILKKIIWKIKIFFGFLMFFCCINIFPDTTWSDIRGGLAGTIAFYAVLILIAIGVVIWSNHDKKENQKKYKRGGDTVK